MKYNEFTRVLDMNAYTAFVTDSANSRYAYTDGYVSDAFDNTDCETEFEICPIEEFPEVREVMVENFLADLEPAPNVQDDEYEYIKSRLENNDAMIGYWKENNTTVYMLIL